MSDNDPELPDYLTEAILSERPSAAAVDLVKDAFSWRNIEQELLQIAFDSIDELAAVRAAGDFRTIEFSTGDTTIIVEFGAGAAEGRVYPAQNGQARLNFLDAELETAIDNEGFFRFATISTGTARFAIILEAGEIVSPVFTLY